MWPNSHAMSFSILTKSHANASNRRTAAAPGRGGGVPARARASPAAARGGSGGGKESALSNKGHDAEPKPLKLLPSQEKGPLPPARLYVVVGAVPNDPLRSPERRRLPPIPVPSAPKQKKSPGRLLLANAVLSAGSHSSSSISSSDDESGPDGNGGGDGFEVFHSQ